MTKILTRRCSFIILGFAAMLLSSCGIMGGTTRSVVQLDTLPPTGQLRPIVVGSVSCAEDGVRRMFVGPSAAEGFNKVDLANFEDSLGITLLAATRKIGLPSGDLIRLHVLIRKYFLGTSSRDMAIFAGVDWALADPNNQILFQDSFYATRVCQFPKLCLLGSEKDSVNSAIIKRIAQNTLTLATGGHPESFGVEGTYSRFESAVATMPDMINGWGVDESKKVELEWAEMKSPTDWRQRR